MVCRAAVAPGVRRAGCCGFGVFSQSEESKWRASAPGGLVASARRPVRQDCAFGGPLAWDMLTRRGSGPPNQASVMPFGVRISTDRRASTRCVSIVPSIWDNDKNNGLDGHARTSGNSWVTLALAVVHVSSSSLIASGLRVMHTTGWAVLLARVSTVGNTTNTLTSSFCAPNATHSRRSGNSLRCDHDSSHLHVRPRGAHGAFCTAVIPLQHV